MKIEVTQKDIENGEPGGIKNCPIARAVARVFPNRPIEVWLHEVDIGDVQTCLPDPIVDWIQQFDSNMEVKPISFDLDFPTVKPSPSYPGSCESGAVGEISAEDIKPIEP